MRKPAISFLPLECFSCSKSGGTWFTSVPACSHSTTTMPMFDLIVLFNAIK